MRNRGWVSRQYRKKEGCRSKGGMLGCGWCTPLIWALKSLKQANLSVQGQSGLHSKFQYNKAIIEKPWLRQTKKCTIVYFSIGLNIAKIFLLFCMPGILIDTRPKNKEKPSCTHAKIHQIWLSILVCFVMCSDKLSLCSSSPTFHPAIASEWRSVHLYPEIGTLLTKFPLCGLMVAETWNWYRRCEEFKGHMMWESPLWAVITINE